MNMMIMMMMNQKLTILNLFVLAVNIEILINFVKCDLVKHSIEPQPLPYLHLVRLMFYEEKSWDIRHWLKGTSSRATKERH